ncbi:MAG: DMT family transporter [Firmicutes bacterium]|nr:DMT family transporter [Bacillota bacterium]
MKLNVFALGLGALAGLLMAVQGAMNAMLSKGIGVFETSLTVNLLGLLLSGALVLLGVGGGNFARYPSVPWYASLGGFLGVGIIYAVSVSIAKTSAAPATTAIIFAQVLTAALLDYFGVLGLPRVSFTWLKGSGILLMAGGAYLLLQSR